jgi:hypothetical protein
MKHLRAKLISRCLVLLAGSACLGIGLAAQAKQAFRPDEWVAVSDQQLDTQRGGFDAGSGLAVSFGIIRTVMVNGDLVSKTSFNLPDVTQITPEQARIASAAIADSGLVQIGPNNFVAAGVRSDLAPGTLIQNSLSDQQIQTLTVINTGVNSLGLLKALNTQTVLNDALLGATGSR